MSGLPGRCRVGIDVGGTVADFVLSDGSERLVRYKEPSVPDDPSLSANRRVTITLMREDPALPPNLTP